MKHVTGRLVVGAVLLVLVAACASETGQADPTGPGETQATTKPSTTPTTAVAAPTTAVTTATTTIPVATTSAPTTVAPRSTTTAAPTAGAAEGSGCTPGEGALGDGIWFGYVLSTAASQLEFDLACWFTGDAAVRAAAEDGEESPPPNDYYVRNLNPLTRSVTAADTTEVVWYPSFGDPTSEETTTFPEWITRAAERDFMPGVWLEIDSGIVVNIHEQWTP